MTLQELHDLTEVALREVPGNTEVTNMEGDPVNLNWGRDESGLDESDNFVVYPEGEGPAYVLFSRTE
jgi:hypothetical protein